jgi:hypothetical protein
VVGRHLVVEPQHLGPATEKCRTVEETREVDIQDWPDELVVEIPAQFEPGNEGRHGGDLLDLQAR